MSGQDDLKSFRIDAMMGGGFGGPALASAPSAAPAKQGDGKSTGWRVFESLLDDQAKFESVTGQLEKSMAKLEELAKNGKKADDKADARRALRAYDHVVELLKLGMEEVTRIRKERAAQAAAAQKAAASKAAGGKK